MEDLGKRAGYLKGLLEGANLEAAEPTGKLLAGVVELLGALAERVESLDELMEDLNDYVQSIDDDLTELENDYDGFDELDGDDDEDDELSFDGEGDDEAFPANRLRLVKEDDDDEPPEDVALAVNRCSACGQLFFTSIEDAEDAEYLCPHCGQRVHSDPLNPDNAPFVRPVEDE